MAIVGEAHIIVRAVTNKVRDDIRRGFAGTDSEGRRAGQSIGRSFRNGFEREAKEAYTSFRKLSAIGYTVGPAIAGIASALSAAASGAFAFGAQMAAAAPAALSLAGALSALAQAAATVRFAMGGVGAAISAGLQAGGGGGGGGVDMSTYYDRIKEARRNLAMTIERAAEDEQRAAEAVASAWDDYQSAIVDTTKAIDNYKRAQKEAAEQTQQLGFDVEDAALAQERAAMALEDARAKLAAVSDLPVNSAARKEAELAFKEADLNYRRAADRNNDLQQQQEEANAAGTAGADTMIQASQDVADAKKAEEDAFKAYQQSVLDAERTRRDAQRSILDAERQLKKALEDLSKAGAGGGGGIDAFAAAMAKLSPEAQAFVRYVLSIQDAIKKLRAAAGQELFPKLIDSLKLIVKNIFPILEGTLKRTGSAVGDFALGLAKALTQRKNMEALERVMNNNAGVIRDFGRAAADLVTIVLQLLDSARPLTREFSGWIAKLAGGWKDIVNTKKSTGELASILDYAGGVAKQLGDIFGNVVTAIGHLGAAASGPGSGGEMLLNAFQGATQKFEDFTQAISSDGTAQDYFMNAAESLKSMASVVVKIVEGFIKLGDNAGVKTFFDTIGQDGGAIDSLFTGLERISSGNIGSLMGDVANNLASIINSLTDSGSIEVFFTILRKASEIMANVFSSEIFQKILVIAGGLHAIATALWLITIPLTFIGKAWVGAFLKMGGSIKWVLGGLGTLNTKLLQSLAFASYGEGAFAGIAGSLAGMGALPLLAIAAGIAAIVAVLVLAYQNSENFRQSISDFIDIVKGGFLSAWDTIKSAVDGAMGSIDKAIGGAGNAANVFKVIGDGLAMYVQLLARNVAGIIKFLSSVIGAAVRIIGSVLGGIISFVRGIVEGISSALSGVGGAVGGVSGYFEGLKRGLELFWNVASKVFEWLGTVVSWVWDNFASPLLNVLGRVIGWLIGSFLRPWIDLFNKVSEIVSENWDKIKSYIETGINAVIDYINGFIDAWNMLPDALGFPDIDPLSHVNLDGVLSGLSDVGDGLSTVGDEGKKAATSVRDFNDAINDGQSLIAYNAAMDDLTSMFKKNIKEIDFGTKKGREYGDQIFRNVQAIGDQIDATDQVYRKQQTANEGLKVLTEGLKNTKMPPETRAALIDSFQGLIDKVKASGGDVTELQRKLDGLRGKTVDITFRTNWDQLPPEARKEWYGVSKGGLITGPGTGTSDSVGPFMLSNREFVVRAASVAKFGVGFFDAINRGEMPSVLPAASRARSTASSEYMNAGGGSSVVVNVYPSQGMSEAALADKVSRTIRQQMRKGLA